MTTSQRADPLRLDEALRARVSVRGFMPDPVPMDLLRQVFDLAGHAPSNCNAQPWVTHVLSGARLRRLGAAMQAAAQTQTPRPDVPMRAQYQGVYRDRQIGAAKALFAAIGIAREDVTGRSAAFLRNFDAFGAPHAAFLFLPEGFDLREAADLGGYAQSLMLAMAAQGIGSCAQGALSLFPDLVRAELGLDPGPRLMMGIAFGWPDPDHPANAARTSRDEAAVFHD
jgi:nitroreductase